MEYNKLKDKDMEVIIDIDSSETSREAPVTSDSISSNIWESLNKLLGGLLNYNRSKDGEPGVKFGGDSAESVGNSHEILELLVNKKPGTRHSMGLETLVGKGYVKERRKSTKNNKAAKPPRPPNGPALDAADKWLIKEITRAATMKRERVERIKALKKMQLAKISSSSTQLSSPRRSSILASIVTFLFLHSSPRGSIILALIITFLFLFMLTFQDHILNTYGMEIGEYAKYMVCDVLVPTLIQIRYLQ